MSLAIKIPNAQKRRLEGCICSKACSCQALLLPSPLVIGGLIVHICSHIIDLILRKAPLQGMNFVMKSPGTTE